MSRRPRREFTEEFKLQMVKLYNNGKPTTEIVKEYDLTRSAFQNWVKKYNATGSFKACDNRTEAEKELIKMKKENHIIVNTKMYNLGKIFLNKIVHFYFVLFEQFYFYAFISIRSFVLYELPVILYK